MAGIKKYNDTCDLPDCDAPFVARGMCRKHYMAWHKATPKHLRTPAPGFSRLTVAERFNTKVDRSAGPDACWIWLGSTHHRSGHGEFFVSKERGKVPAHTFAIELATGKPCPADMEGCHHCDNPPCCNPAHLYYGTRQQNVDDMWARGRGLRGSRRPEALLTEGAALAIRHRYAGGESAFSLSKEFGTSEACVYDVVAGRTWKHVAGPIGTLSRDERLTRKDAA